MNATLDTAAGNELNQDRGAIIECPMGLVLVMADGVGGRSGGTKAAVITLGPELGKSLISREEP